MEEDLSFISHLPEFYQTFLIKAQPYAGLPIDQMNLITILIFQAIFGLIYRNISNVFTRYLYGTLIGFLLMYSLYGVRDSFCLLSFIIVMYPILLLKNSKLVFFLCQITLLSSFVYMYIYHYLSWRLDFTTSLMGIFIRLHTLSCDINDYDDIKNNKQTIKFKRFQEFRVKHACDINNINFGVYMSYMLFFIHILCGSNLTINEFLYVSDNSIYQREGWIPLNKSDTNYPSASVLQIIYGILQVILTAGIYLFGKIYFNFNFIFTNEFQNTYTFYQKVLICPISSFLNKFKYHFGWKCLDLSLLTSNVAFSGIEYDKKDKNLIKNVYFERGCNIYSLKTAFPQYTGHVVRYWNMTVNQWLTYYIFYRIKSGSKATKMMITRLTSALFHGVYPAYWFFFFCSGVFTKIIDDLRLCLPTFEDETIIAGKSAYNIKSMLLFIFWCLMVIFTIDFVGISFMQLNVWETWKLLNSVYWFPFIIGIIDIILYQIISRTIGIKQTEKDKRNKYKTKKLNNKVETKKEQ